MSVPLAEETRPARGGSGATNEDLHLEDSYKSRAEFTRAVFRENRRCNTWCKLSKKGTHNSRHKSHKNKVVYICDGCKSFELVGRIRRDGSVSVESLKHHSNQCRAQAQRPTIHELVEDEDFVKLATNEALKNRKLSSLVINEYGFKLSSSALSRLKSKLEIMVKRESHIQQELQVPVPSDPLPLLAMAADQADEAPLIEENPRPAKGKIARKRRRPAASSTTTATAAASGAESSSSATAIAVAAAVPEPAVADVVADAAAEEEENLRRGRGKRSKRHHHALLGSSSSSSSSSSGALGIPVGVPNGEADGEEPGTVVNMIGTYLDSIFKK
mmetsp:Transcript_30090/g.50875  ORF Transcript_30090/g.50875 Transcript_30090/m.50875 type:complete len:330 (-) Transcript_30090:1686-2675(-)